MAYHIYTTRGLVLSLRPRREADRIYSILTRDLGLIQASAIGVRKEASKLRGHLEPFTLSIVSLVRGKEYWRVTSAGYVQSISSSLFTARPLALLEKLIQGEAPNVELFNAVEEALVTNKSHSAMSEMHLVSQILFHLGYLKKSDLNLSSKLLLTAINEGLHASHL